MEVQIETQNVEIPVNSSRNLAERVRKSMSHVGNHVLRLHLSLRDVNGLKGGRDKVCTIRATLASGGEVVVVDRNKQVRKALFNALRRGRVVINRELKRRRQQKRRRDDAADELSTRIWLESA
ncbi:MAG: hypothetical protein ACFHXK_10890 [bacterium]